MASKVSQRVVYLVTAAIVASMVGGFALAQLQLGQTNNSYQGSQTTTVTPLPGLSWQFTALSQVNVSTLTTLISCGQTAAAACSVGTAPAMVCAGTFPGAVTPCHSGDFIEQVNLTTLAATPFFGTAYPVTVSLTVAVTGTPFGGTQGTYQGPTIWFTEVGPLTNSAESIALLFDIGQIQNGPGSVTSVSVIATT